MTFTGGSFFLFVWNRRRKQMKEWRMSHILVVNDGLPQFSVCDVDEGKKTLKIKKKCIYSVFCSPKYITAQKDIAY